MYHQPKPDARGDGGQGPPNPRKDLTTWNQFQRDHAGKGYSNGELSALFKQYKAEKERQDAGEYWSRVFVCAVQQLPATGL